MDPHLLTPPSLPLPPPPLLPPPPFPLPPPPSSPPPPPPPLQLMAEARVSFNSAPISNQDIPEHNLWETRWIRCVRVVVGGGGGGDGDGVSGVGKVIIILLLI